MVPWWVYTRLGTQSHREGRAGSPILSAGMWSCFTSLSHRSLGGTPVPLAIAHRKCTLSHPFGYHHPTSLSNWETHPHNSPSYHDRDTCTTLGEQMTMLLIPPGGGISEIRGGWSHGIRHDCRGAATLEAKRQKASEKTPKRKQSRSFSKDMDMIKAARRVCHPSHRGMFT